LFTEDKILTEDNLQINSVINDFFSVFTNSASNSPAWDLLYKTCIAETIIIKKNGLTETIYNLETFIAPRKIILTDGTLIDFREWEETETTTITGHMAQRISSYAKSGTLHGKAFHEKGTKLFQLLKTETGWKIHAMIWEDF